MLTQDPLVLFLFSLPCPIFFLNNLYTIPLPCYSPFNRRPCAMLMAVVHDKSSTKSNYLGALYG